MDIKLFFTTFGLVFLAELGDKTQLATMAFSANSSSKLSVFLGAAIALCASSFIAVLAGSWAARVLPESAIRISGALLFIGCGVWMLCFSGK